MIICLHVYDDIDEHSSVTTQSSNFFCLVANVSLMCKILKVSISDLLRKDGENVTEKKKRKLIELTETFFTPFSVREFQEFFFLITIPTSRAFNYAQVFLNDPHVLYMRIFLDEMGNLCRA